MDRLDSMAVLLAAVDAGSLSGAARALGTPLATVSRKVAELEAHLKTRLLHRSSRKLTLTESGRAYVDACRQILEDVSEAERAAAGEYSAPRGDLVVTAPIVFGRLHVLPVVVAFLRAYPEIDVRLVLSDRTVNLVEEHVDLAVRVGSLPDSSLVATRIGSIRQVVCASPAYFADRGTPSAPGDLAAHDCITFEGLARSEAWTFRDGGADVTTKIHSRLVTSTAESAIDAALAGLGITRVLSYQVASAIAAGTLRAILEPFEPEAWPIHLVHSGARRVPQKVRAFLDFAAVRLRAALGAR